SRSLLFSHGDTKAQRKQDHAKGMVHGVRLCHTSTIASFVFFRERSDRVVEWIDHEAHEEYDGKEPRLFSVMPWEASRNVAVRHAPACPD
ncbi:hypothetical protein, partial [Desulfatiferula olefinivorans]